MSIAAQKHAKIIKPGNDALQLDTIHEKNGKRCLVFANMIEKRVLQALCSFGSHCSYPWLLFATSFGQGNALPL
jgi:hypothetical protein